MKRQSVDAESNEPNLSQALLALSVHDRNAIDEEVHGVSCLAPEESPEFLNASLDRFQAELVKIDRSPAYDRAQQILRDNAPGTSLSYIHSRNFKLRFLRCELFDASKAARRYCKYLDLLLELHGEIALTRPIRLNDLGREGIGYLKTGSFQPLGCRDRSGRRIICCVPNGPLPVHVFILVRALNLLEVDPELRLISWFVEHTNNAIHLFSLPPFSRQKYCTMSPFR